MLLKSVMRRIRSESEMLTWEREGPDELGESGLVESVLEEDWDRNHVSSSQRSA